MLSSGRGVVLNCIRQETEALGSEALQLLRNMATIVAGVCKAPASQLSTGSPAASQESAVDCARTGGFPAALDLLILECYPTHKTDASGSRNYRPQA